MREMGIITYEQMYSALGIDCILVAVPMDGPWIVETGLETGNYNMEASNDSFSEHPLMDARYLDDLFEVLDRLLRGDTAEDLANDLQEAFDRAKKEIQVFQGFQG